MSVIDRIEAKVNKRIVIYDLKNRNPLNRQPDCKLITIQKQIQRRSMKQELMERYIRIMEIKLRK